MNTQNKSELRAKIKLLRENLPIEIQQSVALKIKQSLINTEFFKQSKNIAVYSTMRGEVDTLPIIEAAWNANKNCYLPILRRDEKKIPYLTFGRFNKDSKLIKNKYGIFEPTVPEIEQLYGKNLDLIITPLVAFDKNCNRLGYGGGYYDRTFAFKNNVQNKNICFLPILIGIAYELQEIENLAIEPWDVPLDYVLTENKLFERFLR